MIFDDEQVSWLARARAQSLRLADARAQQSRPWRPAARPRTRGPIQWAIAGALTCLLLASGAWALHVRAKREAPRPPAPAAQPIAPRALLPAVALPPPPPPSALAKSARRKAKKPGPPRPTSPLPLEDGDGELILVAPHEPPTPLFSPEEWKRRGSSPQP